jgi:hypothetical protein
LLIWGIVGSHSTARPQFTRRSCEQLGIQFELRLVGDAREGLGDNDGVEVGVEEAVLEVRLTVAGVALRHPAVLIALRGLGGLDCLRLMRTMKWTV